MAERKRTKVVTDRDEYGEWNYAVLPDTEPTPSPFKDLTFCEATEALIGECYSVLDHFDKAITDSNLTTEDKTYVKRILDDSLSKRITIMYVRIDAEKHLIENIDLLKAGEVATAFEADIAEKDAHHAANRVRYNSSPASHKRVLDETRNADELPQSPGGGNPNCIYQGCDVKHCFGQKPPKNIRYTSGSEKDNSLAIARFESNHSHLNLKSRSDRKRKNVK
jgi:hypothetical protein